MCRIIFVLAPAVSNLTYESVPPATINLCEDDLVKAQNPKKASAETVHRFASQDDWTVWLEKNHRKSDGLWLRLAKKDSGLKSVSYSEALEIALCYGWIDGQKKAESEQAWLQRFLPRSARSIWSKINREKALALIAKGQMMGAGLAAIEAAKKNGNWDSAYDSPRAAEVPDDLQAALDANPEAREFFRSLDKANRYAVLFRIQTVKKAATRAARIHQFVKMLATKERIHEPRESRRSPG